MNFTSFLLGRRSKEVRYNITAEGLYSLRTYSRNCCLRSSNIYNACGIIIFRLASHSSHSSVANLLLRLNLSNHGGSLYSDPLK